MPGKGKVSSIYLVWAVLGTLLIAMASFIRGIESAAPLPAKFSLSLAFLILSSLLAIYFKCTRKDEFKAPWM